MAKDSMPSSSNLPIQVIEHPQQIEPDFHDLEAAATPHPDDSSHNSTKMPLSFTPNPTSLTVVDKTLTSTANLAQLLPTGTVLAFESLSSSFTNNGMCTVSNKYLTAVLIYFCLVSCITLTFTDSLVGQDGKLYYGIATFRGFYVFNFTAMDDDAACTFRDLQKLRITIVDFMHAIFTAIVFLSVAFTDTGVHNCFFAQADENTKQLLDNLPLGAAVLSSFVFLIFPTMRKGIGYTNASHNS